MTDVDELVKRLRGLDYKTDLDEAAADTLERQAKWLEGFVKHSDEMAIALSSKATRADHLFVENDKLRTRIAELRAALKLYDDALEEAEAIFCGEYADAYGPMFKLAMDARAARAAIREGGKDD